MSSGSFKNVIKKYADKSYIFDIYKKQDLKLNKQQWLKCHKTKPNQTKNFKMYAHVNLQTIDVMENNFIEHEVLNVHCCHCHSSSSSCSCEEGALQVVYLMKRELLYLKMVLRKQC